MTIILVGLTLGALYALVALGYNMVLLTTGVFNFAYAHLIALGAFLAYWGLTQLELPLPMVVAMCVVGVAVAAYVVDRVAVVPILRRRMGTGATFITTIGAGVIIAGTLGAIWGTDPLLVDYGISRDPLNFLGGAIQPNDLILFLLVVTIAVGTALLLNRTKAGLAALASAENPDSAVILGINSARVGVITAVAAGAIAGLCAVFVGSQTYAVAHLGDSLALTGFIALVIGGVGTPMGALFGGLIVGMISVLGARFLGSDYPPLLLFAVLLITLLVAPQGLLGRKGQRVV